MKSKGIKASEIMKAVREQGFRCAYTGLELTPENASADHRVPVCLGGKHDIENIAIVIRDVNNMKGSLPIDRFVELCGMVYKTMSNPATDPELTTKSDNCQQKAAEKPASSATTEASQ